MADPTGAGEASKAVPEGYKVLREGQASILQRGNDVFYNPVQVTNRDMSIAVLKLFAQTRAREAAEGPKGRRRGPAQQRARDPSQGLRVLEAMAASGLRALRYAAEVEGVAQVVANDLDPSVVEAMRRNVEFTGGDAAAKVVPRQGDARVVMLQEPSAYDVVDLDPYGAPVQLLDGALQAVADGGLLCVTATDMSVLCGNNGEACFAKYGCYPLHRPYCHEQALRILLACLAVHAARYKRHIVPVLSLSIDFYCRVFVRIYTSAQEVKSTGTRLSYLWQSQGCDSFYFQPLGRKVVKGHGGMKYMPGAGPAVPERCPETGAPFVMGGPLWNGRLHDPEWVAALLQLVTDQKERFPAYDRIHSILTATSEELPNAPLFWDLHSMCKVVHCTSPKADVFRSALVNAGYKASSSHACPLGVKTDAPPHVLWDIMRCWVADHPVKPQDPESAAGKILGKAPSLKADFSRAAGAQSRAKLAKVARFLPNPEANWGPKPKHGRGPAGQAAAAAEQQQGNGAAAAGAAAAEAKE